MAFADFRGIGIYSLHGQFKSHKHLTSKIPEYLQFRDYNHTAEHLDTEDTIRVWL